MGSEAPATAEIGNFSVTANTETAESIVENLTSPEEREGQLKKAASDLGKKGGKAAAEARAKEAKEAKKNEAKAEPVDTERGGDEKAVSGSDDSGDAEAEAQGEEEKAEAKKPNPAKDPKARVELATRREAEAKTALAQERRERERLAAEVARLRAETEALRPKQEASKAAPKQDGKPKIEDFEDYEKYLDARDEYNRTQTLETIREKIEREEREEKVQKAHNDFMERMIPHRDKIPDYMKTLRTSFSKAEGEEEGSHNWIANELVFNDNPDMAEAVALHLMENEDVFQRIAALRSPRAVSRELAKIEARLEAATAGASAEPEEKAVSKAAPPVRPVTGAPSVASVPAEYREGMSFDEYNRIMGKPKAFKR